MKPYFLNCFQHLWQTTGTKELCSNYPKIILVTQTSFVPNRAERGEKKLCASNQKETLLFSQIAKMSNKRFVIEKLHALNCVCMFFFVFKSNINCKKKSVKNVFLAKAI